MLRSGRARTKMIKSVSSCRGRDLSLITRPTKDETESDTLLRTRTVFLAHQSAQPVRDRASSLFFFLDTLNRRPRFDFAYPHVDLTTWKKKKELFLLPLRGLSILAIFPAMSPENLSDNCFPPDFRWRSGISQLRVVMLENFGVLYLRLSLSAFIKLVQVSPTLALKLGVVHLVQCICMVVCEKRRELRLERL